MALPPRLAAPTLPSLRIPRARLTAARVSMPSLSAVRLRRRAAADAATAQPITLSVNLAAGATNPRFRLAFPAFQRPSLPVRFASIPAWRPSLPTGLTARRAGPPALPAAAGLTARRFGLPALPAGLGAGWGSGRPALPSLPAGLPSLAGHEVKLGRFGAVDARVAAGLAALTLITGYGVAFADVPAPQQASVAVKAAPAKPAAAPVDPFAQSNINSELRALRKTVGAGDQARSLTLLADGAMGTTIVNGAGWENVMVRGTDLAVEPLVGEAPSGATLDLADVRGGAITRVLDAAKTTYSLPSAKLGSLRLTEHPGQPGRFMWTGVWNDVERTTLYADQDGRTVGPDRPR